MKEDFRERLEILTIEARNQIQRSKASLRNVILFYIFIFAFILLYSGVVMLKIRELADPSIAALLLSNQMKEQLQPLIREKIKNRPRPYAAIAAENMVPSVYFLVEMFPASFRQKMSGDSEKASEEILKELTPRLDCALDELLAQKNLSPESGKAAGEKLFHETRSGADRIFHQNFSCSLRSAAERLKYLRELNPDKLTRQEHAERNFLLCLLFFCENERYRDMEKYGSLVEMMSLVVRNLKQ